MKIKKNDTILIISGKDKGKKGKVLRVLPEINKIVVEGISLVKKHRRAKNEREKGQVVEVPAPIDVSNVKLVCSKCGQNSRIGYRIADEKKYRICKKCQSEV